MNKKNIVLIVVLLLFGFGLGRWVSNSPVASNKKNNVNTTPEATTTKDTWTCAMHPQIRATEYGKCPICGMELIRVGQKINNGNSENSNVMTSAKGVHVSHRMLDLGYISTVKVVRKSLQRNIHLLGKVQANERDIDILTAKFGGRIEQLYVNYVGQHIKKNQKIATIYSPNLVSYQKELLETMHNKKLDSTYYVAALRKLQLGGLTQQQIQTMLEQGQPKLYFDILSNTEGIVTAKHVESGDYVKEDTPLFEITDLTRVWVMLDAYEDDLPWIKVGDEAHFTIHTTGNQTYKGKINQIDPFIDSKTRVAKIRIEQYNPQQILKPGMFVEGNVSIRQKNEKFLVIPASAVLWRGQNNGVVYVKDSVHQHLFRYRNVMLGEKVSNSYPVIKGLVEGEEIAAHGAFKIDAAAQLAGINSMMNTDNESNIKEVKDSLITNYFYVNGNCSICKQSIERAANELEGVKKSNWDKKSKQIRVVYDAEKVTLKQIHKAIAMAGYDTEQEKASEEAYQQLMRCCQYKRTPFLP